MEYLLPQKNVLVLNRWGWKFNTSALAKMMFPCIQNWTFSYTALAKSLGQFRNNNSIDPQNGRKYKTEEELSIFPSYGFLQLLQNPTALTINTTSDYSLSFSMPVDWTWCLPVQINPGVLIHLPIPQQHCSTLPGKKKASHYKHSDAWHYSINQMLPVLFSLVLEEG